MNKVLRSINFFLFMFFFAFGSGVVAASINPRIKVDDLTGKSLLIILRGSESLHSNLVLEVSKRDNKKIKTDAAQLLQLVRVALKTAREKEPAENLMHLEKILISTEGRLQDFLNVADSESDRRLFYLREFFQHITQIARQYEVPHKYNIFFCPKDKQKGVWIQKSTKAQNPFDMDGSLKNCGSIVK